MRRHKAKQELLGALIPGSGMLLWNHIMAPAVCPLAEDDGGGPCAAADRGPDPQVAGAAPAATTAASCSDASLSPCEQKRVRVL